MKTIHYCPEGEAIPDQHCEERARKFLENQEEEDEEVLMKTSTENLITMVRASIAENLVSHKVVRFLFQGRYLYPNECGRLSEWPLGFCDTSDKALMRILTRGRD